VNTNFYSFALTQPGNQASLDSEADIFPTLLTKRSK